VIDEDEEVDRTTIGVGALLLALLAPVAGSANIVSRNICADMTCASEGSEAATVACKLVFVEGSRRELERERKRTSRASWVRPLCVRDPRMVWLCLFGHSVSNASFLSISKTVVIEWMGVYNTFPLPVTPNVANNPSLPSPPLLPRTPSTNSTTPVPRNKSN
jgi:hypothetical protein